MTSNITVPVPDDRVAEFYQFFGLWLAGTLSATPGDTSVQGKSEMSKPPAAGGGWMPWGETEEDLADAALLWNKFSARARAMFSLLIDNPNQRFTGDEIAERVDIPNGAHGVAGVLAWPGRHSAAMKRGLPSEFDDTDPDQTYYFMPPSRAELFKAAREQVEGKA